MRLPRDISGVELEKLLKELGYQKTRQTGSHMRLTTEINGEHSITIPNHSPIKIGTLNSILNEIATHHKLSKEEVAKNLFQ
jgi:predicted RNA binding protein YcfA (HicA-like mRNA interferase family)